jgi:hypothetical protein
MVSTLVWHFGPSAVQRTALALRQLLRQLLAVLFGVEVRGNGMRLALAERVELIHRLFAGLCVPR